jgi:hypothetical protein
MAARLQTNYAVSYLHANTPNATLVFTYAGDAYPRETFKVVATRFEYENTAAGRYVISDQDQEATFLASKCTSPAHTDAQDLIQQFIAVGPVGGGPAMNVAVTNFPATYPVTQSTTPWVTSGPATNLLNPHPISGTVATTQSTSPWVCSVSNLLNPHPISGTVAVSNFPATQPVSGTVAVSNFPATQPVSGTVTANQGTSPWVTSVSGAVTVNTHAVTQGTSPWITNEFVPPTADIIGASRTTTGTLVTIPTGRTFRGSLSVSCTIAAVGTSSPTIATSGAGVVPTGTLLQINATGLLASAVANSNTINDCYIFGGSAGATVTFTVGAAGTSSGQIAGRLL